ncbi:MAG: nitrilase-related carbon-nitrogen hydrolase [Verrucomicrobiales bacterium]
MNLLKVGIVQQANGSDRDTNVEKSIHGIRECAAAAELVVLQELHTGLYFCQAEETAMFDLAEPIPGPSTEQFGAVARDLGVVLVTSLFERRAPGIYHNTAVVS